MKQTEEKLRAKRNKALKLFKATALNAVFKIYHPLTKVGYDDWSDESRSEQRDHMVEYEFETMRKNSKIAIEKYKSELAKINRK